MCVSKYIESTENSIVFLCLIDFWSWNGSGLACLNHLHDISLMIHLNIGWIFHYLKQNILIDLYENLVTWAPCGLCSHEECLWTLKCTIMRFSSNWPDLLYYLTTAVISEQYKMFIIYRIINNYMSHMSYYFTQIDYTGLLHDTF